MPLRNTLYPVTLTSSALAFQFRSICSGDLGVCLKLVGVEGGVVSGGLASTLNATLGMAHGLTSPSWGAVVSCGPAAVTFLSSVRLPNLLERDVKSVPA